MCFPHVRLQDRQQRDNTTPCPNTHRPRNSKADLRFLRCYVAKEGGRNQSGHSSFPFRFDRVYVRDTDFETLLSPVTCMRSRYSANFSHFSFTRVVERPKRHNNSTILSQKKAGGSTAWASFRLAFRFRSFARHGSRSSHLSRACDGATLYSEQRWCLQGRSGSRSRCSRERSANAT